MSWYSSAPLDPTRLMTASSWSPYCHGSSVVLPTLLFLSETHICPAGRNRQRTEGEDGWKRRMERWRRTSEQKNTLGRLAGRSAHSSSASKSLTEAAAARW